MATDIIRKWWSGRNLQRHRARDLYAKLVAQARQPVFYSRLGVPDTLDGRFELIALHVFLVAHRLKQAGSEATSLVQTMLEVFVDDMDRSLRELGVSDLSVGRKVKQMVSGVYGRIAAYDQAVLQGEAALADAIRRNVYGTVEAAPEQAGELGRYLDDQVARLAQTDAQDVMNGNFGFRSPGENGTQ